MRQLGYTHVGEPWDIVEVQEVDAPRAAAGQVVIELEAAPVHIADLKAMRGELPLRTPPPAVGGYEGVGRIVALGEGVADWEVGDRALLPLQYGAWRELAAVPADDLWRVAPHPAAEQMALVRINMSTAYLLLHAYRQLEPGDWVVQTASNSNVGGYLARLAAGMGVNLVSVVRRPELVAQLQAAGHRHVLLDGDDLPARVRALAPGGGVIGFDPVAGMATARLAKCLQPGSMVVTFGFLSGEAFMMEAADVLFRGVQLQGFMTERAMGRITPERRAAMKAELEALIAGDDLKAEIAGVYRFEEAAEALRHAARTGPERAGKVILRP